MSAPLVVNTKDGTCWTRRGSLRGGEPLYAPEGVCQCPEFVMATLAELAEHGIVGSADVLLVPVGSEPQAVAEVFVPRTERSYWVDIAAALNAAHSVGMPVGIDLDGTLTDRNAWSVVWDRVAERWVVAGYDDEAAAVEPDGITKAIAPTQALRELVVDGEHYALVHHDYAKGRDLPGTGGLR